MQIHWLAGVIFTLLYSITILGLVLVIIAENRNPLKTISWVIVLLLAPGIGLLFYFFFGQDNRKQRIISRRTYKRIMKRPQTRKLPQDVCVVPATYQPLATLLNNNDYSSLLRGSDIRIYTQGADKFNDLLADIRQATAHIHIQYYIFCDDEVGNRFKSALIEKAREGVKVRLMYDDVGCWNVKDSFFNEMKEVGIEVYPFLKVAFPIFTSKVNYRNHRKIVVIDGQIGYMGGMNIADRYEKGTNWGAWRDSHFRIIGKGVYGLQAAFLTDWYVVSKQLLNDKIYYPPTSVYNEENILQIVTSGPVGQWRTLLHAYIFAIANAKQYIYIQTPYFLPTEGLNQALLIAALGGIDVRLMLPKKSDTRTVNMATHSFVDELIKAGVKVYFYEPGFLHAKMLVIDDALSCIGSANMDFRSFEHNFEVSAFVYDTTFAKQMKRVFHHDMQQCERLIATRWLKRPWQQRLAESFMRLFSPLL